MYDEKNFSDFNAGVTELRDSVNNMLAQIAVIDGTKKSESYKFLMTANLLDFDENHISTMVKQTRTLANYLDGTQVSGKKQKGIFEKAYDYVCKDAIFGGEAANIVSPYVNEVSGVFSYSYKVMAIVLNAKLWINEHYDEVSTEFASDASLMKILENGNFTNDYYTDYWKLLLSENSDSSIAKIHNKHFSDEDPMSTAEKYNTLVKNNWYSYIRSADVVNDEIEPDLVPIDGTLGSTTPSELGVNTSKKTSATESMVNAANTELYSRIYSAVTQSDIKRIIEHVFENKNGVFCGADANKTTILDMLEEFGFEIPAGSGTEIFVDSTSKYYDHDVYANQMGNAWDRYIAYLKVNGTNCGKEFDYDNGTPMEKLSWNDTTYYDYWHDNRNPSSSKDKNKVENCSFYYFRSAPLSIRSESDFIKFISDVTAGNTYYQRTVVLDSDINISNHQYGKIWAESKNGSAFRGTFDGQFHKIIGLNETASNSNSGLFHTLGDGARVQNLVLENVNLNSKANCGALAGNVSGNAVVSGVNVNKDSKIYGTDYVGGLIGRISSGSLVIKDCDNYAEVTASDSYAGGIVGYSEGGGNFTKNTNTNKVSGKVAGGIMGQNEDDSINFSNCKNSRGDVRAVSYAGGILGYTGSRDNDKAFTFDGCSNSGYVYSDTSYAGGIAGVISSDNLNHSFMNCTNENSVTGHISTGGIIGMLKTDSSKHLFDGNKNYALVEGKSTAGGIIGFMYGGGEIKNNVNGKTIVCKGDYAGGIVGRIEDDKCTFTDNTNNGGVSSSKYQGQTCGYDGNRKSTY